MKQLTDKWDAIDKAIEFVLPKTQPQEVKEEANHPFSKFCSKDENVTIITDNNGKVMKLVKDRPYPVYENIQQVDDYFVYTFSCRQKYILKDLTSVPKGIAINKAFFDTFSDNDKFIVEIIPNKGKEVLERYTIDKATASKEGKIKQFPGYEKQVAISLQYWKQIL